MLATDFHVSPRKICKKIGGATLSGRTLYVSISATLGAIQQFPLLSLFLLSPLE